MASQRRQPAFMGVNVSPELRAAFRAIAVAEDRTIASELRRLIRQRVEAVERGSARPKPSAPENRAGLEPARDEA